MICHRLNGNTGAMKKLFEAAYDGLSKKRQPVFRGEGGYIDRVGPYDYKYRMKFEEADELRRMIHDLVEAYNNFEGVKERLKLTSEIGVPDEILEMWDRARDG